MKYMYISAIEEIHSVLNIEENIGIATFGHYTGVVQHMTNDYEKVQNAIGKDISYSIFSV